MPPNLKNNHKGGTPPQKNSHIGGMPPNKEQVNTSLRYKINTSKIGNPDTTGYHPDTTGYHRIPPGYQRIPAGYRPDTTGYHPDTTGYHPDTSGYHPDTTCIFFGLGRCKDGTKASGNQRADARAAMLLERAAGPRAGTARFLRLAAYATSLLNKQEKQTTSWKQLRKLTSTSA